MKHLGDITKINGAEIEAVDVITGGSPCQDLSIGGKRARSLQQQQRARLRSSPRRDHPHRRAGSPRY